MKALLKLKMTPMKGGATEPINRFRFENIREWLDVELTSGNDYDIQILLRRKLYRNLGRLFLNRLRGKRTILDLTDDLLLGRRRESFLKRWKREWITKKAVRCLVRNCEAVVCCSEELRNRYAADARSIHHIEDAIDLSPSWKTDYRSIRPRVVWVGTSHNLYHLLPLETVLSRLQESEGLEIVLISKRSAPSNLRAELGRDLRFQYTLCEWELSSYLDRILEGDIAIAPLFPDLRSAAKSSNKLLTYLCHGMPVVASRIQEYERYVENGKNGYLASREEEWGEYLLRLMKDPLERERIGTSGREFARSVFSRQRIAKQWNEVIRQVA